MNSSMSFGDSLYKMQEQKKSKRKLEVRYKLQGGKVEKGGKEKSGSKK